MTDCLYPGHLAREPWDGGGHMRPLGAGGGGGWEWARVQFLCDAWGNHPVQIPTRLLVWKLDQATGVPLSNEQGNIILMVRVVAASDAGFSFEPPLEECTPLIIPYVGVEFPMSGLVRIEYSNRPAWTTAGYQADLSGWWLRDLVYLTCYPIVS